MKKFFVSLSVALLALTAPQASKADTLAQWTFETSQPGVVTLPTTPGANIWLTNIPAEFGIGTASGLHASAAAVYSSPAGNVSLHSFSANNWSVGDVFQFNTSTLGYSGVSISYDQTGSGTGPRDFGISYSTDGTTFIPFGSTYSVLLNGAPNPAWGAATGSGVYSMAFNLSSITVLDNASTVWFRVVDGGITSINLGVVAAAGTDRVDNFTVTASLVPEPSSFALAALGGAMMLGWFRRRR